MRQKQAFIPTLRQVAEADQVSHHLLLRAGYIRQSAAGIYSYLPIAFRVLDKIQKIVCEEMNAIHGQQVLLPLLHPMELWEKSGRRKTYGSLLMHLQDRHERSFVVAPTHEEVITELLRGEVHSYKKLPLLLYQLYMKFRDEKRPRSGLLRGREFVMKDAYSFHSDAHSLNETFQAMYEAYCRIFSRCRLRFCAVQADAGAIGGTGTKEFMVLAEAGEDTIVLCQNCDYASNVEMAEVSSVSRDAYVHSEIEEDKPLEKVPTPFQTSIIAVSRFLQVSLAEIVKSLLFLINDAPVLVLMRGDHQVNEIKLKNVLEADQCFLANEEMIRKVCGVQSGFVGPVGLGQRVPIVIDEAVAALNEMIVGANETGMHLRHVKRGRDFHADIIADIRVIESGDRCPRCQGSLRLQRGIEVGHIFKVGTKYSQALEAFFLDANGKEQPMLLGTYGIGVSRMLAAIVEQHHDEQGIIWPSVVSPYLIHLIGINMKDDLQFKIAQRLYTELQNIGFEVLWDDREERAGVKFCDAGLIGIPIRIIVGTRVKDGMVELQLRRTGEKKEIAIEQVGHLLPEWILRADKIEEEER